MGGGSVGRDSDGAVTGLKAGPRDGVGSRSWDLYCDFTVCEREGCSGQCTQGHV